jgi:hypothetical protein
MLMDHVRSAAFFAPLLALFSATAAAQPEKTILSAWVQMAGDTHTEPYPQSTGHAVIRVVISAACPVAKADGKPLRLAVREAASINFPVNTSVNEPESLSTCTSHPPPGCSLSRSPVLICVQQIDDLSEHETSEDEGVEPGKWGGNISLGANEFARDRSGSTVFPMAIK